MTKEKTIYELDAKNFDKAFENLKEAKECLIMFCENTTAVGGKPHRIIAGASAVIAKVYEEAINAGCGKEVGKIIDNLPKIIKKSVK